MLFLVYTDMIRVGLLKGEFRPPVMPPPGKTMPPSELARELRGMVARGGDNEKNGNSSVLELPGEENDTDGEVYGR